MLGWTIKVWEELDLNYWLGKHPVVRWVVMNPVDYPHGGGEGRAPIARKKNP